MPLGLHITMTTWSKLVCLAITQLVSSRWPSNSNGRSVFNPGADNLDLGFHSSSVGKMSSSQYVDGWLLQKTAELKRAPVRWPRVAYAASGEHYRTYFPTVSVVSTLVVHLKRYRTVRLNFIFQLPTEPNEKAETWCDASSVLAAVSNIPFLCYLLRKLLDATLQAMIIGHVESSKQPISNDRSTSNIIIRIITVHREHRSLHTHVHRGNQATWTSAKGHNQIHNIFPP